MKVKILKDFDYSFDGVKPVSFKEGEVTEKFVPEVVKKLLDRGWVGVKGSKTESEKKPTDAEKKVTAEKKRQARVDEMIKLGAKEDNGDYLWLDIKIPSESILDPDDGEWSDFIAAMQKKAKELKDISPENENSDKVIASDENLDDGAFDDSDEEEPKPKKDEPKETGKPNKQKNKNKKNK